ncbi:Hypothetical protein PHPALM_13232 [Phytophthora palmivora]|uniref:Uncharacterized protein n=1 Tax=Phytophthora palmivora TaxID=4796 RepID=A0A2P4XXQ5_9STRA|nr:Hypothetical protein PHPALM_13232 [Phytophthora palmivora]
MKPKTSNDAKTALELAESSEWSALDRLVTAQPERADDMDDFGMMPLHWACTDTHVPLRIVKKLVDVAPSALNHKNKGGLLPLHIAVKAATKLEVLRALVQASPDVATCLFEETPTGETPAELARAYQLTDDKVSFLVDMEQQLRAAGKAPDRPSARFQAFLNQPGGFPLPADDTSSELTLAKSRIEKKLEDATRMAADAKKERNAVDANVAELRNNRIIDINRISFDDDEEDNENQNNGNGNDFTKSFMQGRHRQNTVQVEKNIELIEDKEVNVAETCSYLGQVYLDRGEYSSAVVEFRKSVDADRKDVDVWINLARALHGAGEYYDAEIAIRRALALTPKNYASQSMLGKILHSKGEHDKAVEVFREALSLMDQEDDSDEDVGSMTVGW